VPVKIIHPDHVEIVGLGHVLLTAPHVTSPDTDLYTGQIVEEAALTSRSFAVIGNVNREFLDLNRIQSAQSELRKSIEGFIAEDGIRYLLDIRGKKEPGVNIGAAAGKTCSDSTTELVKSRLSKDFTVKVNSEFMGDEPESMVTSYNRKDAKGNFVVETMQVEFGHEERQFQREKVISDISEIADILDAQLVASRGD
jgi:hypothetical protein